MSVILALRSKTAVVVAGDSQRVESDGVSSAPYRKVFRIDSTLFAHCGLLEFGDATVERHLQKLRPVTANPNATRDQIANIILPILSAISDHEVGFIHRRLDILVAARSGLAFVGFFPNPLSGTIDVKVGENSTSLVTGDPLAHTKVGNLLHGNRRIGSLSAPQLKGLARSTLKQAVAACSIHPDHPPNMSCCLPIQVLSVP